MVYMTGQRNIIVSDAEIKILRNYLLDHHGMLFGDNGGSSGWEGQFVGMMRSVLPRVEPISVYLDHPIHRIPYPLPRLPTSPPTAARTPSAGWWTAASSSITIPATSATRGRTDIPASRAKSGNPATNSE